MPARGCMNCSYTGSKPAVSVLMAVYNGERFLHESVESILDQTFPNFEFLIVDDGSTDSTAVILQKYAELDVRIRLVTNEKNIGLVKSLNKGLKLAKGKFIARQDADDVSHSERLAAQVQFLTDHPAYVLVGTRYLKIDNKGNIVDKILLPLSHNAIQAFFLIGNPFAHGSVLFRNKYNISYDESFRYAQDLDLWIRFSTLGFLANLPDFFYSWRFHDKSITNIHNNEQLLIANRITQNYCNKLANHNYYRPLVHSYLLGISDSEIRIQVKKILLNSTSIQNPSILNNFVPCFQQSYHDLPILLRHFSWLNVWSWCVKNSIRRIRNRVKHR